MSHSIYRIQFQKGLGLPEFIDRFGSEEQCEDYLFELKWKHGFRCPACSGTIYSRFRHRNRPCFQCSCCRHQTSLTAGTLLHGTHLPLRRWFMAIYLISEVKTCISSLELHRMLHVNHKTAWRIQQKLMQVMFDDETRTKLSGRIEMDDAYLGGKSSGGKRGRGAAGKQPFIAAVQTADGAEKTPLYAKIVPIAAFTQTAVSDWTRKYISEGSHVVTDALACFNGIDPYCCHEIHVAAKMTETDKEQHFKWVNTILANVKTGLTGTFHSFQSSKS